jgi:glycosyltransferase involved in cell wall biosynthesis
LSRELVVLMTAYNAEKTIRRALDSLARNSQPFDLLIVDDCSRRPLAEFLGPLGDGVEIVRPDRNLGVAGAKNFGLKRLLSQPYEFVAMMDADDISHPDQADGLSQGPSRYCAGRRLGALFRREYA